MPFTRDRWPQKGNCFVLMPYGVHELRDGQKFDWDEHYHDVIEVTVRDMGMTPWRADSIYGPGTLLGKVWQGIQEAEVIIADLTGRNPNVLYEFGLAHVIGKKILILTMNPDDVPVDLSQFVQIVYKEGKGLLQLTRDLHKHLDAALKEPPAESDLMPLRGAGIEEIPAKVLSVMETFATVEARDGRKGFLNLADFSWTRNFRDLTKVLHIGKELKGAFVNDANGQQKYSLAYGDSPWPKLEKEFPIGEVFKSVVVNVREGTGAWVNMNYGIHGFIPQGSLPRGIMPGTEIKARVVEIQQAKREVKLQLVEVLDQGKVHSSWPRRGQVFEGQIDRTAPDKRYVLVKIVHEDRSLTGMLHSTEMTPLLRERLSSQDLRSGDQVMVEVTDADPFKQRINFRDCPSVEIAASAPQLAVAHQAY